MVPKKDDDKLVQLKGKDAEDAVLKYLKKVRPARPPRAC
jgi:hypothetical protein